MCRVFLSSIKGNYHANFTIEKVKAADIRPEHYIGIAWRIKQEYGWPNWKFVRAEDSPIKYEEIQNVR